MIRACSVLGLILFSSVGQAGSIDCSRSGLVYQPTQPWPFDSIVVGAYVARACAGGFFPICSEPLPKVLGGKVQIQTNTVSVDLYGSDGSLPSDVPPLVYPSPDSYSASTSFTVGPLEPGVYQLVLHLHNIDAQGIASSCIGSSTYPQTVTIRATNGPVERLAAIEYYDASLDHYFVTADPAEIAALDRGAFPGWARTGESFTVFAPGKSGGTGVPVCRFYGLPSAGLDSHFYTADAAECAEIPTKYHGAWQLETANAFEVWLPSEANPHCGDLETAEVFRLWNQRVDSDHRLTTDGNVLLPMLQRGYVFEGIGSPVPVSMCSP